MESRIRNLLAVMKRGESIIIPHLEITIEVEFNSDGWFKVITTDKVGGGASIQSTTSLREATQIIARMFNVKVGHRYQHLNGNVYDVIAIANIDSGKPQYPLSVVYQGPNGKVWTKTMENFNSKMTRIK